MPLVNESEIEPCEGVVVTARIALKLNLPVMTGFCSSRMPVRLHGFDGKWRCPQCHRIHNELVYSETRFKGRKLHDV